MILRFYEWRPVPQNPTSYCAEKDSEFYETKRLENNLSLFLIMLLFHGVWLRKSFAFPMQPGTF